MGCLSNGCTSRWQCERVRLRDATRIPLLPHALPRPQVRWRPGRSLAHSLGLSCSRPAASPLSRCAVWILPRVLPSAACGLVALLLSVSVCGSVGRPLSFQRARATRVDCSGARRKQRGASARSNGATIQREDSRRDEAADCTARRTAMGTVGGEEIEVRLAAGTTAADTIRGSQSRTRRTQISSRLRPLATRVRDRNQRGSQKHCGHRIIRIRDWVGYNTIHATDKPLTSALAAI